VNSKLLEERQAEMRARLVKGKISRAMISPSLQEIPVEAKIVAGSGADLQSHDAMKSDRAIVKQPDGSVTVSRDDLYTLVWSEPMMTVAARYGISAN
jgi:hypothetical protein